MRPQNQILAAATPTPRKIMASAAIFGVSHPNNHTRGSSLFLHRLPCPALPFQFLPYNTCRILHHTPNPPADQIRNQDKSYWGHPNEPSSSSLFKQVMRSQAAAAHHTSSSQSPPRQPKENARHQHGPNGLTVGDPGLLPPPSAPPSLVSALKGINGAPDPLVTLREKPREHSFDSPYARSANSTAPGSPRM